MTEAKLEKYLSRTVQIPVKCCDRPFYLISNSLGNSIKRNSYRFQTGEGFGPQVNIKYLCRSGATFAQQFYFTRRIIKSFPADAHLLVLLGTCDLTKKSGKFIQLRHTESEKDVATCINFISKFIQLAKSNKLSVTFLEIPPYSIQKWNTCKGHSNPSIFKEQDRILADRVATLNHHIRLVNDSNECQSPKFRLDVLRNKGSNRGPSRPYINFNLFPDGVHPCRILAEYWSKRIGIVSMLNAPANT